VSNLRDAADCEKLDAFIDVLKSMSAPCAAATNSQSRSESAVCGRNFRFVALESRESHSEERNRGYRSRNSLGGGACTPRMPPGTHGQASNLDSQPELPCCPHGGMRYAASRVCQESSSTAPCSRLYSRPGSPNGTSDTKWLPACLHWYSYGRIGGGKLER